MEYNSLVPSFSYSSSTFADFIIQFNSFSYGRLIQIACYKRYSCNRTLMSMTNILSEKKMLVTPGARNIETL